MQGLLDQLNGTHAMPIGNTNGQGLLAPVLQLMMQRATGGGVAQQPREPAQGLLASEPLDFTDKYNTALDPDRERAFKGWLYQLSKTKGYDAAMDLRDYDLRGAFKSGEAADGRGHMTDEWKKPNHPTFSDQSVYNGVDGHTGGQWTPRRPGRWDYQASPTNLQFRDAAALQEYFKEGEPNSHLYLPKAAPQEQRQPPKQQPREISPQASLELARMFGLLDPSMYEGRR